MQTSSVFPALGLTGRQGRRPETVKPASSTSRTVNSLGRTSRDYGIAPPKRRRQITPDNPQPSNPFGPLKNLVGKALTGKGQF